MYLQCLLNQQLGEKEIESLETVLGYSGVGCDVKDQLLQADELTSEQDH